MRKMLAVARKEFRQIVRDRRTLLTLLFVPVFFLLLYGYALNFDIRHVRLAVEDRDHTPASRSLVAAFVNSGLLRPRGQYQAGGSVGRSFRTRNDCATHGSQRGAGSSRDPPG